MQNRAKDVASGFPMAWSYLARGNLYNSQADYPAALGDLTRATQSDPQLFASALPFAHYNFVRVYSILKVAPAVAAGLERYTWNLSQLLDNAKEVLS